jgi:DNA-binding response OmpR family regulator
MKKIMAIDDEASVLTCLQNVLQARGYEVITSNDPEEGSKTLINDETIILALLDVKMPKKDGFEIYRELRNTRKIPVLFVTAYPKFFNADSEAIVEMWNTEFADGTTDIVYKPFHLESLYEKVESLIGPPEDTETTEE